MTLVMACELHVLERRSRLVLDVVGYLVHVMARPRGDGVREPNIRALAFDLRNSRVGEDHTTVDEHSFVRFIVNRGVWRRKARQSSIRYLVYRVVC